MTTQELDSKTWNKAVRDSAPYCFWLLNEPLRFLEMEYGEKPYFLTSETRGSRIRLPMSVWEFPRLGTTWKGASVRYAPYAVPALEPAAVRELFEQMIRDHSLDYFVAAYSPLVTAAHAPSDPIFPYQSVWQTALVDLRQEEDALWKGVERHARKNIERLKSLPGLRVRILDDAASLEKHYLPLLRETRARRKAGMPRFYPCPKLLEITRTNPDIFAKAFVVSLGEEPLAGLGVLGTREGVVEVGSAQSEKDLQGKYYAHDLLKWEIISWAKSQGVHFYDLGGFNPVPQDPKEEGIKRFKTKWGGELYSFQRAEWQPLSTRAKLYEKAKGFMGKR